jgi:hypothetical protein
LGWLKPKQLNLFYSNLWQESALAAPKVLPPAAMARKSRVAGHYFYYSSTLETIFATHTPDIAEGFKSGCLDTGSFGVSGDDSDSVLLNQICHAIFCADLVTLSFYFAFRTIPGSSS